MNNFINKSAFTFITFY